MIRKIRFLEPGNLPYRVSLKNLYTYDKYIRTPGTGLMTLATIARSLVADTLMYSESISKIKWADVLDADIVLIGVFTFNANRGYELARYVRQNSHALVVLGGLHASMNYPEAVKYCDYVLLGEGDESILELIRAANDGKPMDFPGLAYFKDGKAVCTGKREPPENIDTVPDRNILYRYHKMAWHLTIWPQVHAFRGCPHNCNYCALVRHFGRRVRTRSPQSVIEDIKQAIAFHAPKGLRWIRHVLWITDDNFFAERDWAISVLNAIIDSGIKYYFTIQARFEVGFDDEMLVLLRKAGVIELSMGIEFLEDEAFETYHKKSTREDIIRSIKNIQRHGISVRGLFIFGADNHTRGVGKRLAEFVIENKINGMLIQSMCFVPGTPVYEQDKERLIHEDWSKYNGNVVHYPKKITPYELQQEIVDASNRVYTKRRLLHALFHGFWIHRIQFLGEYFWQKSICRDLKQELPYLKEVSRRQEEPAESH
ncbi:B12-binding domain-containing radical SAM protein [Christensenella timonensis]|uniref:B12-binding domain-containing radical SAM protein n=1 Tax=Christensenella timonensis TaxID=1816678 RepID=UPI000833B2A5|nr:radical SAM protein [Christensenella timonensis]